MLFVSGGVFSTAGLPKPKPNLKEMAGVLVDDFYTIRDSSTTELPSTNILAKHHILYTVTCLMPFPSHHVPSIVPPHPSAKRRCYRLIISFGDMLNLQFTFFQRLVNASSTF